MSHSSQVICKTNCKANCKTNSKTNSKFNSKINVSSLESVSFVYDFNNPQPRIQGRDR